jgi:serine/threonine protein kinase
MRREAFKENEINILRALKECPFVVHIEATFHEADHSYIVMEEMGGGDLLEKMATKIGYKEDEARVVAITLLEAVCYCHNMGIAHRDIKPENILLLHDDEDTTVQLADFGLTKRFRNHETGEVQPLLTFCGSPEYASSEVFNREEGETYDERCYIWSIGTVIYVLLAGYAPFQTDTQEEMIDLVGRGKFQFHNSYWAHITLDAKELVAGLLQVDTDERWTLEEALTCSWLVPEKNMIE